MKKNIAIKTKISTVGPVRNSVKTKLDQSFQLSEVRNKSKLSVVSPLLDHKGVAPQGVFSLNSPPLKETYSDGLNGGN